MEPNLEDMDDYNKPLKPDKKRMIIIFFAVLLALYTVYALAIGGQ